MTEADYKGEIARLTKERDELFSVNGELANTICAENLRYRNVIKSLLTREQQFASYSGFADCRCTSLSREAEQEYENGKCPHQQANALLNSCR